MGLAPFLKEEHIKESEVEASGNRQKVTQVHRNESNMIWSFADVPCT